MEVRASPCPLVFVESRNALIGVVLKFSVKNQKSREINEINKKKWTSADVKFINEKILLISSTTNSTTRGNRS